MGNRDPKPKSPQPEETDASVVALRRKKNVEAVMRYRQRHPERKQGAEYWRKYNATHKESRFVNSQRYYRRHSEKRKAYMKKYVQQPHVRNRIRNYLRNYVKTRRETDVQFSLQSRLSRYILLVLSRTKTIKSKRTMELVGCSREELKSHIEKQFVNGMCWENRRSWHIDHYVPITAFDLTDPEEQKWCFNWRNLRPMVARENIQKSDTIPDPLPDWLPLEIQQRIHERTYGKTIL